MRTLEDALSQTVSRASLGGRERRGLGRHLAQRLAAASESVVDVAPKLSARVRVLSTGNARKNDGLDALATALVARCNERLPTVYPEAAVEVLRLLSERREDLVGRAYPSAQGSLHGLLLRDLIPGGVAGTLSTHQAAHILRGIRSLGLPRMSGRFSLTPPLPPPL